MGQEASIPQEIDGDTAVTSQTAAAIPAQSNGSSRQHHVNGDTSGHHRPGKVIKNLLHRNAGEGAPGYSDKEAARAAAEMGHFDFVPQQSYSSYPQQQHLNTEQQQQQQLHYMQQQQQYYNSQQAPPPPPPPPAEHTSSPPPYATVGVMFAHEKKGGGPRRGHRLINSMRNLSLGQRGGGGGQEPHAVASIPPTSSAAAVNDWERQWDEDTESDEEEEEDSKLPAVAAPRAAQRAGPPPRQDSGALEWDTGVQKEKPNIDMFLPMLRVLGKGSFGKVVLVQKNRGDDLGTLYAMKILKKDYLKKRRQVERTQTERKVLSVVNHPFIMKMHYAFQNQDKLFFVLDYCAGGELFFHLSRFRRFPERVARFYTAELLLAIGHLHKRHIIYRDLKPENVLIDADGHVKLGDFGLAKTHITHPCQGAMSMCGTPEYMSPEILNQTGHGFCVDYWGIGMLVYEMMTGLPPWYTTDRAKLFRRLKSAPLEIPPYFSESCASCVSALLERSPRRRLGYNGVRSAMEHAFFRSINFRALYSKRVEPPIRPCEGWNREEALLGGEAQEALDRATANFDQTFTTMPVDQDDDVGDSYSDDDVGSTDGVQDNTFIGFTYDDQDLKQYATSSPSRERTQAGYHQPT